MIHTVRYAFIALPLGLLFAGCSGNDRTESRPTRIAAQSSRTRDQAPARAAILPVSSGGSARPALHLADRPVYTAPADQRYGVTIEQIREHLRNRTALIIDARSSQAFALGHIRGAFNMPAGQHEGYIVQLRQTTAPDQFIIIYCNGPQCDSSDMVYEYLAPQGFTNMRVFKPGWEAMASARDLR